MDQSYSSFFCLYLFPASFLTSLFNTFLPPFFLGRTKNWETRLLASSCQSVRPFAWNNSYPTGRIFKTLEIWTFFEKKSFEAIKVCLGPRRTTDTFHEYLRTFMTTCRWILLTTRRVEDKKDVEKIKTHSLLSIIFFSRKPCHFSDNVEKYGRTRQATRHMRFARWITKAT